MFVALTQSVKRGTPQQGLGTPPADEGVSEGEERVTPRNELIQHRTDGVRLRLQPEDPMPDRAAAGNVLARAYASTYVIARKSAVLITSPR